MAAAAQEGRQHEFMRAMLVLKMGCQQWLEDYGGDTSGFIYKSVKDGWNRLDHKVFGNHISFGGRMVPNLQLEQHRNSVSDQGYVESPRLGSWGL